MFNRFKGFNLDTFLEGKIAEDETKKAQQQSSSTNRTPSTARRPGARGGASSGKRESSRLRVPDAESPLPTKGPDPEDFVIGDDASDISGISRAATPKPVKEGEDRPILEKKVEGSEQDDSAQAAASPEKQDDTSVTGKGREKSVVADDELPLDVRRKLARLDTLSTKYQGMLTDKPLNREWHPFYLQHMLCTDLLKNYRTAHSRVAAIEPFEAALREHTSLASIAEPGALVEFLEARNLQKDMVMEELRRISGEHSTVVKERDELKVKLEQAEQQAKEAFDEAAGLREERQAKGEAASDANAVKDRSVESNDGATKFPGPMTEDETFFDYDTELPHLQEELQEQKVKIDEQTAYINELSTENATLRQSYDSAQLDLSAMQNKVGVKERELNGLKAELKEAAEAKKAAEDQESEASASLARTEGQISDVQTRLKSYQEDVEKEKKELREKLEASEKRYQLEHDDGQQEKRKEFQAKILNSVREQLKEAQEAKSVSEGKYKDLELEFNRISSECDNKGEIITSLRGQEDANKSLRDRNAQLEIERDEAMSVVHSKKNHESAVASLRSQLKRTERDRDDAYKIIIQCGQCQMPTQNGEAAVEGATQASIPATRSRKGSETTQQTEASTQPTETSTPPAETDTPANAEAKKKNKNKKKKSKAKKDTAETAEPIKTEEPKASQGKELANQHLKFVMDKIQADEDENEKLLRHHEGKIEEQDQTIRAHLDTIRQKDVEIAGLNERLGSEEAEVKKLSGKLKDQDALVTELEDMRDTLADLGKENTDFKHERKTESDGRATTQKELDEALAEGDKLRRNLKEAEEKRDKLQKEHNKLQNELVEERKNNGDNMKSFLATSEKEREGAEANARQAARLQSASEKQIEELQSQIKANEDHTAEIMKEQRQKLSVVETEKAGLEKDLAAANSLAQTRFKDLTDLREHSNKLQAELKKVKDEASELRSVKLDLDKSNASLKKLEAKEKDLRSDISVYKSQIAEKDTELADLRQKVKKGDERSTALEDTYERARQDLEDNEKTRDEAIDARDKAQAGLKKTEGELRSAKTSLDDLQKQVTKFRDEATSLRKELDSKSALVTSSKSLADGYQDQQREMAAQVKEHKDRADGLEEELADVHRLLSERGREGETMRRLIEDVKNERDRKVRDMQEERDRAMEERDRADDEASTIGRRKAREIQELKTKLVEAEKDASNAKDAREDAERRERDFRSLREDLERRAAKAEEDLTQRREAMAQIQETLDESQRQYAAVEKERSDLQRSLEERQTRLEKVQKSSKALAEEVSALKTSKARGSSGPVANSARTSVDSSSRVTSPVPRNGIPQASALGDDMVNRAVIRSTLLNFMQQKDKRVQMSMVGPGGPLAKMLGFGPQDEQSWMAAVSTR